MHRQADASPEALEALSDAVQAIGGVLGLEDVLQLIVDRVRTLVGARYAALGIADERGMMERFITSGVTPAERAAIGPIPRGHGLLGLIIREGRSYRVPDIGAHRDSYGFPPNHPPMRSFLGVPISVEGRPVGNLYLTEKREADEFTEDDQRLVELFASHAGIAIENARLRDRLHRLVLVEERERIAKDLHDGIIQSMYAVSLSLEDVPEMMVAEPDDAAVRIDRAIEALNLTIRDLRSFISGLGSELVERTDLVGIVASLADQFRLNTLTEIEIDLPERSIDVPTETRAEIAQVAREALSNIARHAGASRARIALALDDGVIRLEISDNGRGFDHDAATDEGHFGLLNMRNRALVLGGALDVWSRRGEGTRIIVTVPLHSERDHQ